MSTEFESDLEKEIEVDPIYYHAIWVCPNCAKAGRSRKLKRGLIFVAVCGKLTRFGGAGTKCPECVSLMSEGRNKVCHFCARRA